MFKEFEDYVLAAAVAYGVVLAGLAIKKEVENIQEEKLKDISEWMDYVDEKLKGISDKLTKNNASRKARVEAYTMAEDLMIKHIEFYEGHTVRRAKAVAYCKDVCTRYINIWN